MTLAEQYREHGYVVIPTGLPAETLRAAQNVEGPLQPQGYHWSDGPRVFEAWKGSQAVRDVAWCPAVLDTLAELHGRCRPFQTINFRKGTNQALHQDAVHFQTLPLGEMVGVWVALEATDESNGTLCVVPGTHDRYVDWQSMGLPRCEDGKQFSSYRKYERIVPYSLGTDESQRVPVPCSAGDAIIWHANLLHGGWPCGETDRTRYSQATHYYTEKALAGWAPMFSEPARCDFTFKSMRWFDQAGARREFREPWPVEGLYS